MSYTDIEYPFHIGKQVFNFFFVKFGSFRQDAGLIQHFIRINIADACDFLLVHETVFNGAPVPKGFLKSCFINPVCIRPELVFIYELFPVINEHDFSKLPDGDDPKSAPVFEINDKR
ncbi:MAG: hypothetical protein U5K27_05045 [Desulfotignum sp.]|nr:hypothetical protein [Desulfotignum sp.]